MLSIQKITGFVNDCVTFRQKNNLLCNFFRLVLHTGAGASLGTDLSSGSQCDLGQCVGPASSYTSTENSTTLRTMWPSESWAAVAAMPSATPACGSRVMPRYFWIASLQRARDQRKERTKRENAAQPEKTHIRPAYYPPRQKATGIWSPGKELLSGIQKKLLPSSLRDATHSPSGTFVPPPPAGGVFLTEGGSGEKEKCSILPKAPSLRELARRKT